MNFIREIDDLRVVFEMSNGFVFYFDAKLPNLPNR